MKILHVVPAVFDPDGNVGGAERYAVELVRELRRHVDVRLLTYGERDAQLEVGGVPVEVVQGHTLRGNRLNRVGLGIIGPGRWADVVHCHQHHILSSSLLGLFGRVTGRPVVATDHGGGGFDLSWYVNTDSLFAAHLHVSDYSRARANQSSRKSARVIYGGVDAERFRPAPWSESRNRVLFVGRVLPHKRVDTLIEALPANLCLDVIGPLSDRRYAEDLQRLAGRQVTFHGQVDELTLNCAYRKSLCVVLPSDYDDRYGDHTPVPELLGQVLLEGMASGIPAVCTNAGGMPEVVKHGRTGFVVERNDPDALRYALEYLAADQARAAKLGSQGRARVLERFAWPAVAQRCVEVYRELLSTKRSSLPARLRRLG